MIRFPSSQHQEPTEDVIQILEYLGSFKSEYPPELFTARRKAFVSQVEQRESDPKGELFSKMQLIQHLKDLDPVKAEVSKKERITSKNYLLEKRCNQLQGHANTRSAPKTR